MRLLWIGLITCLISGCSDRVRASDKEITGSYITRTNTGKEELILQPDKTYVQMFSSPNKQFENRGTWKTDNLFLDGTQIELASALLSEDETIERRGFLILQVHREKGKLRLARNEAADWYYDRAR
jgi:hypothetical protein